MWPGQVQCRRWREAKWTTALHTCYVTTRRLTECVQSQKHQALIPGYPPSSWMPSPKWHHFWESQFCHLQSGDCRRINFQFLKVIHATWLALNSWAVVAAKKENEHNKKNSLWNLAMREHQCRFFLSRPPLLIFSWKLKKWDVSLAKRVLLVAASGSPLSFPAFMWGAVSRPVRKSGY